MLKTKTPVLSGVYGDITTSLMSLDEDGGDGGETGIRTLDTLRYTRFPSVRLQPLGHLSNRTGLIESNTAENENLT
jgi:hypothetical protein